MSRLGKRPGDILAPLDQGPLYEALARLSETELRKQILAGGYRLAEWLAPAHELDELSSGQPPVVQVAVWVAMVPEALSAVAYLWKEGVAATLLNLTNLGRLYEAWRTTADGRDRLAPLGWLLPTVQGGAPIITLHDGAAHTLAWLGSVHGVPVTALGVDDFGQSGGRADLYHHYGIDAMSIATAAFWALDSCYAARH